MFDMPKPRLTAREISRIKNLRKKGHTLYEIKNLTRRSNGAIWKYIQGVLILPKYQEIWKIKKGGSKNRSLKEWQKAKVRASKIIKKIGFRERMLILSCLYWGEGNKTELNLINSDPSLIKTVLICLKNLGIKNSELRISLRLFNGINRKKAIYFWTQILKLPRGIITKIDVIHGNKVGKLKYGMCRVRVKKGGKYFKLIMSMVSLIKENI